MRSPARLRSSELRRGSPKPSAEAARHPRTSDGRERAALVGLFNQSRSSSRQVDPEHSLDELAGLASAAGATVVLRVLQDRPRPDAATFLGSGKVKALAVSCDELRADVVIFDNELSPAQLRNLEEALGRKVVDRTQLILDIFARRARTGKASCRSSSRSSSTSCPGSSDRVPRCRGSAAASALEALAKPSSRRIGDGFVTASACSRKKSTWSAAGARSCGNVVRRARSRRWRSSATPTPARRRSSTR